MVDAPGGDPREGRIATFGRGSTTGGANLAAGTSWLWVSAKMSDAVDVLFVDEAGQISLANVVAMARSTTNLVLLGDPQQLDQPLKGSHPPGADRSALAHVLAGQATMPPDRGLFLEHTWRMHPALCAFTSEVFYDDRLESEPHLVDPALRLAGRRTRRRRATPDRGRHRWRRQRVAGRGGAGRGDRPVPDSPAAPAGWTDDGVTRPVGWDDVLIVAPYNAQVGAIKRLLPPEARVGTVDKFQGQEAPIASTR